MTYDIVMKVYICILDVYVNVLYRLNDIKTT